MNKQLIGTLVVGLILFFWQFLSWQALNLHSAEMKYTPKQDQIMAALDGLGLEPGTYAIPQHDPAITDTKEIEAHYKSFEGKPWAQVSYKENWTMSMGMNMFRGFVIDLVAAFFLIWILMKFENRDMKNCIMASLAVGVIGYLTIPYLNSIWFQGNTLGHIFDAIVPWALSGVFLGWLLNRK